MTLSCVSLAIFLTSRKIKNVEKAMVILRLKIFLPKSKIKVVLSIFKLKTFPDSENRTRQMGRICSLPSH